MSLAELKRNMGYSEKVGKWLDVIGAKDKQERDEVLHLCATDENAKRYYMKRWEDDVSKKNIR